MTHPHGNGLRRVLLVQYLFYPTYNVAVKQAAKLCKFLPEFGWEPIVLTKDWARDHAPEDEYFPCYEEPERAADDIGYEPVVVHAPYRSRDNALLRLHGRLRERFDGGERPGPLEGIARKLLSAGYAAYGRYPDDFVGWVGPAAEAGVRAVRTYDAEVILSSCPPTSGHLVGSAIASRTRIPWVAQFGDLFGFYVGEGDLYTTPWRRSVARALNRRWMRPATRTAAVSAPMVDYLRRSYGVDGDVVVVGFDPDERTGADIRLARARMRVVHTGSIYPGDQRPELLFDALDLLITERPEVRDRMEVLLVGSRCESELRAMLADRPASAICEVRPRVGPDEALALQRSADVLLALNLTNAAARNGTLSYPSKIFEYCNARRPVLALPADPGKWVDQILETTRCGVTVNTTAEIAQRLARWYDEWARDGRVLWEGDTGAIDGFSCRRQAERLARLLEEAAATRFGGDPTRPSAEARIATPREAGQRDSQVAMR